MANNTRAVMMEDFFRPIIIGEVLDLAAGLALCVF